VLPILLNTPQTKTDWDRWSFHHRTSHDLIRFAIKSQLNITLPDYQLDPIALEQPKPFLEANQQAHSDFSTALHQASSDLEDINLKEDRQLRVWIYLHWQEHQLAEARLGISS
jgi:hypothetical protein